MTMAKPSRPLFVERDERWDDWDLRDATAADIEHAAAVTGPAAWVCTALWLPDPEQAERDLDDAGVSGTSHAEHIREQTLAALDSLRRRGDEWHAGQGGDAEVSPETPGVSAPRYSEVMDDTMTAPEAAALLGVSEVMVRRHARQGTLRGHKLEGEWRLERASVEARARAR
jgi:excisionase family DNA binding protein